MVRVVVRFKVSVAPNVQVDVSDLMCVRHLQYLKDGTEERLRSSKLRVLPKRARREYPRDEAM